MVVTGKDYDVETLRMLGLMIERRKELNGRGEIQERETLEKAVRWITELVLLKEALIHDLERAFSENIKLRNEMSERLSTYEEIKDAV